MQLPLARKIPAKLHDRCFNCLSLSHRVATCRLSWRCRGYRHLASDCKWPRRAGDGVRGRGWGLTVLLARALCQSRTKWLWGAPRPSSSREVDVAVTGNVASATVTCCPQEPDPLAVALCEGTEPPVWVDPMFDELAASLVVSRSVGASTLGHPSTPPAAPLVAQALLADTHSPPRMVQLIYTDAEASGVDDRPPTPLSIFPSALAGEFVRRVSAPLKTPSSRRHHVVEPVALHRRSPSVRLAAKCASRAPNATLQAQKGACVQVEAFRLTAVRYPGSGGFQ
jgi:hypothetical protein